MLGENMKDIDLDCRKQTSAASMAGQFVQNEATCARFEHKPDGETHKNLREFRLKKRLQKKMENQKNYFSAIIFRFIEINFSRRQYLITSKIVSNFV